MELRTAWPIGFAPSRNAFTNARFDQSQVSCAIHFNIVEDPAGQKRDTERGKFLRAYQRQDRFRNPSE